MNNPTPFTPTHTTELCGRQVAVVITGSGEKNGKPRLRVENANGTGWLAVPKNVKPVDAAALRLGTILQDPDAPAERVNAAIHDWRVAAGYEDACTCSPADAAGMGAGVCRSCRAELETEEVPY